MKEARKPAPPPPSDPPVAAGVSMPRSAWDIIDELAEAEGRSRSNMIAEVIRRYSAERASQAAKVPR